MFGVLRGAIDHTAVTLNRNPSYSGVAGKATIFCSSRGQLAIFITKTSTAISLSDLSTNGAIWKAGQLDRKGTSTYVTAWVWICIGGFRTRYTLNSRLSRAP